MRGRIAVVTVALCGASVAHADHDHMHVADASGSEAADSNVFDASVSLVAASFDTTYYGGNYEGIAPMLGWSRNRFRVGVNASVYRLNENGATNYGLGDVSVHGQASLFTRSDLSAGLGMGVSAPTGNSLVGFGMGHMMVMPAAWTTWHHGVVTLDVAVGYGRAIVEVSGLHDHGVWPLVDPMNMSEITMGGSAHVAITPTVHVGARASGGVPVGAIPGHDRLVGAARVAWGSGRMETGAELQSGIVGNPFTIRCVVSTALRF